MAGLLSTISNSQGTAPSGPFTFTQTTSAAEESSGVSDTEEFSTPSRRNFSGKRPRGTAAPSGPHRKMFVYGTSPFSGGTALQKATTMIEQLIAKVNQLEETAAAAAAAAATASAERAATKEKVDELFDGVAKFATNMDRKWAAQQGAWGTMDAKLEKLKENQEKVWDRQGRLEERQERAYKIALQEYEELRRRPVADAEMARSAYRCSDVE